MNNPAKQNALNSLVSDLSNSYLTSYIDKSMQDIIDMDAKHKAALGISSAVNTFLDQGIAKQNALNSLVSDVSKNYLASYIDKSMQDIIDMDAKHKAALGISSTVNTFVGQAIAKQNALNSSVSDLSNLFGNLDSHCRTAAKVLMEANFSKVRLPGNEDIYFNQAYEKIDESIVHQQLEKIAKAPDSESIRINLEVLPLWVRELFFETFKLIISTIAAMYISGAYCDIPGISCPAERGKSNLDDQHLKDKIETLKSLPIDGIDLNRSRFVALDYLNVHLKPNQKSQILDDLTSGQVIILLKKERNWAEIAFRDENGNIQQGWVLNRYLKKFN